MFFTKERWKFVMDILKIKEKLEKENKGSYITKITLDDEKYIQVIKTTQDSFEYLYYKIENNELIPVKDGKLLNKLRELYELKPSDIIY